MEVLKQFFNIPAPYVTQEVWGWRSKWGEKQRSKRRWFTPLVYSVIDKRFDKRNGVCNVLSYLGIAEFIQFHGYYFKWRRKRRCGREPIEMLENKNALKVFKVETNTIRSINKPQYISNFAAIPEARSSEAYKKVYEKP